MTGTIFRLPTESIPNYYLISVRISTKYFKRHSLQSFELQHRFIITQKQLQQQRLNHQTFDENNHGHLDTHVSAHFNLAVFLVDIFRPNKLGMKLGDSVLKFIQRMMH